MIKRPAIIFSAVLLVAVLILSVTVLNSRKAVVADPYLFIPAEAPLLFETSDFPGFLKEFTTGNGLFNELKDIPQLAGFTGRLDFLSGLMSERPLMEFTANNKCLITLLPRENGRSELLMLMAVPGKIGIRKIEGILKSTKGAANVTLIARRDKALLIYGSGSSRDSLYLFSGRGIIALSTDPGLPGLSPAPGKKGNILGNSGFRNVLSASGKGLNKTFIVFRNTGGLISELTGGKKSRISELAQNASGSAEGDLFITENRIIISGYYSESDTLSDTEGSNSVSAEMFTHRVLPTDISRFETTFEAAERITVIPFKGRKDFLSGEYSRAVFASPDTASGPEYLYVASLINPDIAERTVSGEAEKYYSGISAGESEWKELYKPDDMSEVTLYHTPFTGPAGDMFGKELKRDTVIAVYDNYLVSGTSSSVVKKFIYSNILNKTLGNDLEFREFENTMPSRAHYRFYMVPSRNLDYLSQLLDDGTIGILKANQAKLKRVRDFGYQYAPSNRMVYNTVSVGYIKNVRDDSGAEWATLLDTAICIKPFFFVNHNTGIREVFVQDYRNNAYLINQAGRVLWKVRLPERIIGEVSMIDFYGNGKNQLLFTGKNFIHVLDRNGNYIEKFPVKMRAEATAPAGVFDYENSKEYRIIVAGKDRLLYAYDKAGNAVKGWNNFRTAGEVRNQVKHFRVSGKDYLVISDETNVYFLDRTGNIRTKPSGHVSRAYGSEIRLDLGGKNPSIVFTGNDGTVQRVEFQGSVSEMKLKEFSSNHSFDFFDIDNDGRGEYMFIDSSKLYLYDDNRSAIFEKEFSSASAEGPFPLSFSSVLRYCGILDRQDGLIYLVDKKGNLPEGFPLRGSSLFSAGKFTSGDVFHIVVGGDDNFLYNYRMNF